MVGLEEPGDEQLVDLYKGLMVIKKEFTPNLVALGKEFDLKKIESEETPIEPTIPLNERKKFCQNGTNS